MSESKGGGGFGFAPRGDPVRRPADRHVAAPADRKPPEPPRPPRAPITPTDHRAASSKMPWAWLLIGLLLGTGGTLLTSTLWLPERQVGDWGDTSADDLDQSADGEAAAAVRDPAAVDPKGRDRSPGGDDGGQPEIVAVTPEVENINSELAVADDDQLESQLSVDDESDIVPDQADLAESLEPLSRDDAPLLTRDDAIIDENEKLVGAGDPISSSAELEEPLEAPTSVRKQPLEGGGAEGPTVDAAAEIDRRPPTPLRRSERTASDEAPSVEDPPQEAALGELSNGADPADLPPRIRQALRSAGAERESRSGTNGGNGDRLYRVQLAAVDDEAAARTFWLEANARLPGVFSDVEPVFDQSVVDERLYLRIWVGAFDSRIDAVGYCDWLKQQGQDCFVTRASSL